MLSAERRQAISELVAQGGAVNVVDLARRFEVSASTIRRDLGQLERKDLIHRIHGGAIATIPGQNAPSAEYVAGRIGRAAAARVRDNETIFLGPGRLTLETAKALVSVLPAQTQVTVVTNGLEIAHWLADNSTLSIILTGGTVGRPQNGLGGPLAAHALLSLRADRIYVQAAGISPDQGVMGTDLAQAELCRELMSTAGETIVLASPERIGRAGGVWIGPASDVDVIITGRDASDATLWDFSQMGVTILSV